MKGRAIVMVAAAIIALSGTSHTASAVQQCANAANCAQVSVDVGSTTTVKANDTFDVHVVFKQGPDNGQAGGIDEIAALNA